MKYLEEFAKAIIDPDILAQLSAEELPEDVTIDSLKEQYQATQKDVWLARLSDDIKAEAIKGYDSDEIKKIDNQYKAKIKKLFGLDINAKSAKSDEIFALAKEKIESIRNATGNELTQQMADLQNQLIDLKEEKRLAEEKIQAALDEKEQFKVDYQNQILADNEINKSIQKIDWAVSGEIKDKELKHLKAEIAERGKVGPDGSFIGHNGVKIEKPGGLGVFNHVSEFINFYVDKYNLRQVSNGRKADGSGVDPKSITNASAKGPNGEDIDYSAAAEIAKTPEDQEFLRFLQSQHAGRRAR